MKLRHRLSAISSIIIIIGGMLTIAGPSTAAPPAAASSQQPSVSTPATFYNPIADVEDPAIVTDGGYYYLVGTNNSSANLYVRKSAPWRA